MYARRPRLSVPSMVPPADGLPLLIAAVRAEGTGPARIALWSGDDLTEVTAPVEDQVPGEPESPELPVDLDIEGSVEVVELAASNHLTALAGYAWHEGAQVPFLYTSDDRTSWSRVDLGDHRFALEEVAVVYGNVYVAGTDADDQVVVLAVGREGVREHRVELPPEATRSAAHGITGHGAKVLLVVEAFDGSDRLGAYAYTSGDRGATWSGPETVSSGSQVSVSGVVWSGR